MTRVWFERALFVLVLLLAAGSVYAAGSVTSGQQKKQAVLERVKPLAKQGNANAQYNLGVVYDRGYGVERDYAKARKWYKKAAAQGYAKAAHNLGVMYQRGHGVPVDHQKAAHWFKEAAQLGESAAQNNLAVMYARGQGVERNMRKAAIWAARAAQAGNQSATANIPLIASEFPQATISGDSVNIRSKPTTDSVVLKQSNQGTQVVVLQQRGDWSQILFTSDYVVGWVANFLINKGSVASAGGSATASSQGSRTVASASTVSGNSGQKPDKAPNKAKETVEAVATTQTADNGSTAATGTAYNKAISGDVVNIRQQPNTQSSILFKAHQGDRATVLKSNPHGWKYVRFSDGRTGWIAGFLLEDI